MSEPKVMPVCLPVPSPPLRWGLGRASAEHAGISFSLSCCAWLTEGLWVYNEGHPGAWVPWCVMHVGWAAVHGAPPGMPVNSQVFG